MPSEAKPITLWAPGFFVSARLRLHPGIYIHSPWWHVSIKRWRNALFSERYGDVWTWRAFGLLVSVRRPPKPKPAR